MTLDTALVGFAFSAGIVAFLNPCGFAMLPAYVSYFVEKNNQSSSSFKLQSDSMIKKMVIRM